MRSLIRYLKAMTPTFVFGDSAAYIRFVRREIAATRTEINVMHAAAVESEDKYSRLIERLRVLIGGGSGR